MRDIPSFSRLLGQCDEGFVVAQRDICSVSHANAHKQLLEFRKSLKEKRKPGQWRDMTEFVKACI